jgi:uncharacterized circularly permuted ATP-grasp superfamily protein
MGRHRRVRVLEDNSRCPSGVSYVLENRDLLSRIFPEFFAYYLVRTVDDYPNTLLETMHHVAPRSSQNIVSVVLSPGIKPAYAYVPRLIRWRASYATSPRSRTIGSPAERSLRPNA